MTADEGMTAAAEAANGEARTLVQAGRFAEAAMRLRQALSWKPGDPALLYFAGVSAHATGGSAVADRLLRRAGVLAPASPEIAFARGNLSLDLGDATHAEGFFRKALAASPGFAPGRHALAQALMQQHRLAEAEVILSDLVAADPAAIDASLSLVLSRLRRGADAEAASLLRRVIVLAPSLPRPHFLLADLKRRGGHIAPAAACYRHALALHAQNAAAWQGLGLVRSALGEGPEAISSLRTALALSPEDDASWFTLGEIARAHEDWAGAVTQLRRAWSSAPQRLDAAIHLGNALDELDRRADAVAVFETALARSPDDPKILSNLATVLLQDYDIAGASRLYRQALALTPRDPVAHYNLGNADRQRLAVGDAVGRYTRAISIDLGYGTARWNDAVTRLMAGDWKNGFARYEWRWRDREHPMPTHAPWYEGGPLDGQRILLLAEQGFGDMIQFARYARAMVENGGQVVMECYPPLRRLFATLGPGIELVDLGAVPDKVELQAALMQLPLIFDTTPERTYAPVPYLSAPKNGPRIPARDGFKVGLVWAGNSRIEKFHKRSSRLEDFLPVIDLDGVAVYSLQVGPRAADIAQLGLGDRIVDLVPLIGDFADTAALVEQLDLVIAVDTAVAHLAGALARPVWMLPTYVPDWRWLLGRDDTPWYPTMRLYRQGEDRTWPPVVERLVRDLAPLVQAR